MSQKFNYKQDQFVKFHIGGDQNVSGAFPGLPVQGTGRIVGCSITDMPIIGCMYMVEATDGSFPNEVYPFKTISVAECHLEPVPL
jgi:hypothetical protein